MLRFWSLFEVITKKKDARANRRRRALCLCGQVIIIIKPARYLGALWIDQPPFFLLL
jgi:hypothetical protein